MLPDEIFPLTKSFDFGIIVVHLGRNADLVNRVFKPLSSMASGLHMVVHHVECFTTNKPLGFVIPPHRRDVGGKGITVQSTLQPSVAKLFELRLIPLMLSLIHI